MPLFDPEYTLHKPVTIDEVMISFKVCLGFKQYLKDKPLKWGIKFVLSDSTNDIYIERECKYILKIM